MQIPPRSNPNLTKSYKSCKIHGSIEILPISNQNIRNPLKSTDPWKSFPDPTKICKNQERHGNLSRLQPKSFKMNGSMEILPRSHQNIQNLAKSIDPWKSFPDLRKILRTLQNLRIHGNPSQTNPQKIFPPKSTDPWKSLPDPTKIREICKVHGSIEILPRSNQNCQNAATSTDRWKSFPDPTKLLKIC